MQNSILDFSLGELKGNLKKRKLPTFIAEQIFDWVYKKGISDFDKMTNLSQDLRQKLKKDFCISKAEMENRLRSFDGTKKYLFKLEDGELIESVFIPTQSRNTLCLSSQVGCKFGCRFCASGLLGFKRNLSCAEIISQLLVIKNIHPDSPINNIVFMGMGEPLDNYENVLKTIRIINDEKGLNIGARKITISTCGLIPEIKELAEEGMQFELSVSLHTADSKIRDSLMPVNKKYPLEELIESLKDYIDQTNRQVTFEYVLFKDINSSKAHAEALAKLLRGMKCKVNVIPYNEVNEIELYRPSKSQAEFFVKALTKAKVSVTLRRSRGHDINAACGELRLRSYKDEE